MPHLLPTIHDYVTPSDIATFKGNLYSYDIQLWREMVKLLYEKEVMLSDSYGDMSILGILAQLRETIFGFMLWYTYITQEQITADVDLHTEELKNIYITDVLNVSEYYYPQFAEIIDHLLLEHQQLLTMRCTLDDNEKYFSLGVGNWMSFIETRNSTQIMTEIMGEDVIRFR